MSRRLCTQFETECDDKHSADDNKKKRPIQSNHTALSHTRTPSNNSKVHICIHENLRAQNKPYAYIYMRDSDGLDDGFNILFCTSTHSLTKEQAAATCTQRLYIFIYRNVICELNYYVISCNSVDGLLLAKVHIHTNIEEREKTIAHF